MTYFVSVLTFGEAARMVDYIEQVDGWTAETPPELKLQRKLNMQRIEREMVPYLLGTPDRFYSSLTVEVRPAPNNGQEGELQFKATEAFPGGLEFGMLTLDGTEALCAMDGQHRLKSIELAIRQNPELSREHITLILVPFKSIARSQSLFSDLNRYAKSPSKSISLLFTHREPLARIAKSLAGTVPLLQDRVNMESTSLSVKSRHFITLSTLYETTRVLGTPLVGDASTEEAVVDHLTKIWLTLTDAVPQWKQVAEGHEHPAYLRQKYLSMHGVGQQAIVAAAASARPRERTAWKRIVQKLGRIDWRLTNPDWEGIALHGGRVNNTATSIRRLTETLELKIGLGTPPAVAGGPQRGPQALTAPRAR